MVFSCLPGVDGINSCIQRVCMAVNCSSGDAGKYIRICEPGSGCVAGCNIRRRKNYVLPDIGIGDNFGECAAVEFIFL